MLEDRPVYRIREGDASGVIRMKVERFFDIDTLVRHFAHNEAVVVRWRAAGRPIRVFT